MGPALSCVKGGDTSFDGCKYRDKIRFFAIDVGKKCYFRSIVEKDMREMV